MLVWWLWATAGDTTEGYLGGAVKTWGEDDSKACTCDDVMLLLKRRIFVESRG